MCDHDMQIHQKKIQALALLNRQQTDFFFVNFHQYSQKAIQVIGYVHWAALEEMMAENSNYVAHFSVADCLHALERRFPKNDWTWKFVAKTFQALVNDEKLEKQAVQIDNRHVLYKVTESMKSLVRTGYCESLRTAELLLANFAVEHARNQQARCKQRLFEENQSRCAAKQTLPSSRADIFNTANPFSVTE